MLFEDPYKNIHGQTVDTPGYTYDSLDHLSVHKQNPGNFNSKRTDNLLGSTVAVVIFIVIISTIVPIIFSTSWVDTSGDSLINHTYSHYGDRDNTQNYYKLPEIANKFGLAGRTVNFTATQDVQPTFLSPDGRLGIKYHGQARTVFLQIIITPYGMGKINTLRTNCANDSTGNCVVIDNEYHESDLFDVIIHKNEKSMSDYIYYVAISTTLVEIRFNPYTNAPRDDAEFIPILKAVRNTLSEGDSTPDIDEMIAKLELPLNKKMPTLNNTFNINFPNNIQFDTNATDGSNDTYEFKIAYMPTSKNGLQEVDRDEDMDMIIYKTNSGKTYFIFHQGDSKNEYYITIDRFSYRASQGQDPHKNISTKEEFIEALDTLAD